MKDFHYNSVHSSEKLEAKVKSNNIEMITLRYRMYCECTVVGEYIYAIMWGEI